MMAMTSKELLSRFRVELERRLQGKSAWGKQQVMMLVEKTLTDVLLEAEDSEDG